MFKSLFITLLFLGTGIFAQKQPIGKSASLCGKITDNLNHKPVASAKIALYKLDSLQANITADIKGDFCFTGLYSGNYKIIIQHGGYSRFELKGIIVHPDKKTDVKIILKQIEKKQLLESEVNNIQMEESEKRIKNGCYKITAKDANGCTNKSIPYPSAVHTVNAEFNTEQYNKIDDNGFKEASKDPLSTMSIDVDRASYSNVRRFITKGSMPPADAVRVEEMINYFSYNYPQPKGDVPFSITTEYTECAWNKKHSLIHIGIQGKEIKTQNLPANNLVFLIDVSGSMMSPDKLPLVKSGLRLLVDQLRTQDKVSLVVYAGAAGMVLPPTPGSEKDKIMEAIEQLEAGGSTAGGQGIELAYKSAKESFISSGNNRVILATDGDFNVGVSDDGSLVRMIEKKREDGIFLTVLGFGTGNYKDSKMEQLADKGNGNYAYIDDILEAKKVLVKEMGGTLLTIAKDVKIQIEFNPSKVKAYRLVGYENRLLNKEDFNDDKKDAGELGAGHTVTAIYEIIPAGSDEAVASVDPLKYQETKTVAKSSTNEIMTVKFRYKEPKENTSKLITEVVNDNKTSFSKASENCKFASAVAQFGMLLRDSKYKADADYKSVITLAKQSKGTDEEGYRAEFIRLVEMAELLKK